MFSASSATVSSSSVTTANSPRRRGIARLAASVVASGLVMAGALAGAGSAVADETPQHQGGAAAVLDGLKTFDRAVLHTNGRDQQLPVSLFEMTVDGGGKLKTYCIDIHNPTQDQAKYLETPWNQTSLGSNKNSRQDPLDPGALLPAGRRPRGARQGGRHRTAHREDRGGGHPGRHLALLGRRRHRRHRRPGREAGRLAGAQRRRPGGAQGVPRPGPGRGLRQVR